MKKEESAASSSAHKSLEDEGYSFKRINENVYESDGFVEEDWYKPTGTDSLWYYYSEDGVQYIL